MKIEVNIEKKYFFAIMLIGLLAIGIAGVIAYNSEVNDPSILGHSVNEMDWGSAISANVTAAGYCIGNDTYKSCIQNWGEGGVGAGVSKIIAGSGINVSSQTGEVTISSTGGGSGGDVSLSDCTEHDFDVGFGVSGSADSRDYFCPTGKVLRGIRLYYWTWAGGNAPEGTYIQKFYCCNITGGGGSGGGTPSTPSTPSTCYLCGDSTGSVGCPSGLISRGAIGKSSLLSCAGGGYPGCASGDYLYCRQCCTA